MAERYIYRLQDMLDSIKNIRNLLSGKTFDDLLSDVALRAALERFLEILSEASRHVPDDLKVQHGTGVPWRQVADLGNVLRHAYHRTDAEALWAVYEHDLGPLQSAIENMLAARRI